jgi:CDP-diacylglycerol--serine O-phosphatidyltransferase
MAQPKHKKLSLHKMIPNMITLTAIAAGMTSIRFAIDERWEAAVIAIIVAAFMDAFDGAAARLLNAQSKLGAELDSFSDFVCFGVAPALVIFLWTLHSGGKWGWPVCLIFAIAVALRLARFNIASDEKDPADPLGKFFTGVPSPIGAVLCLLPLITSFQLSPEMAAYVQDPRAVGLWALVVAAMMVSHIPTFSSKQIHIPYKMKVTALGLFGILITVLINIPWPTLSLLAATYLFLMPLGISSYKNRVKALSEGRIGEVDNDASEHE